MPHRLQRFVSWICTRISASNGELSFREAMIENGMLILAENVIPAGSVSRHEKGVTRSYREANPGELRRNYENAIRRRRAQARRDNLIEITSVEALDRVASEGQPAIVLVSEGADFLEDDVSFSKKLERMDSCTCSSCIATLNRASATSGTEEPVNNGLTALSKDVVRMCNRIGILVDVAHATGIEQALDISTKPLIYSHGHVSAAPPSASQGVTAARAIYAPLAQTLVDKGGVIGLWPSWYSYPNLDLYSDELVRLAQTYGIEHLGVGTDMFGLARTIIPSYREFAKLPEYLAQRKMKDEDIGAVLGGNYIRVLRQALSA